MNKDLMGHLLLKKASLVNHDRELVVVAAGGDHSLQALATSLQNAYCSEGFSALFMNTHQSHYRHTPVTKAEKTNTCIRRGYYLQPGSKP